MFTEQGETFACVQLYFVVGEYGNSVVKKQKIGTKHLRYFLQFG